MRKVWHLPSRCHVPIVHCVAKTTKILRIIYGIFIKFCNSGLMSFVSRIFHDSRFLAYPLLDIISCLVIYSYKMKRILIMLQRLPKLFVLSVVLYNISPFEELIFKLSCFDSFLFHHQILSFCALLLACHNNNNNNNNNNKGDVFRNFYARRVAGACASVSPKSFCGNGGEGQRKLRTINIPKLPARQGQGLQ